MSYFDDMIQGMQARDGYADAVNSREQMSIIRNMQDFDQQNRPTLQLDTSADKPWTEARVLSNISKIRGYDPQRAAKMYSDLQYLKTDKNSKYYNPYAYATNKSVAALNALGVDTSVIDDDFFHRNNYLTNYLVYNGTTNTPTKPGTKASVAEQAAYEYYQIWKAENDTVKAEKQWEDLQKELKYWTERQDLNLSDEEVLGKIDWSNYQELHSMDVNKYIQPNEYNRAIGYSQDAMRAIIWAARQDDFSGTIEDAMVGSYLGKGKQWKDNPDITAKREKGNEETYNRYALGMTLDEEGLYFGVPSFTEQWLAENRGQIMSGGDAKAQKYFTNVYNAFQTTKDAKSELEKLNAQVERWLGTKMTEAQIVENLDRLLGKSEYSVLRKMDESLASGGDLVKLTEAVDYRKRDVLAYIHEKVRERDGVDDKNKTLAKAQIPEMNEYGKAMQAKGWKTPSKGEQLAEEKDNQNAAAVSDILFDDLTEEEKQHFREQPDVNGTQTSIDFYNFKQGLLNQYKAPKGNLPATTKLDPNSAVLNPEIVNDPLWAQKFAFAKVQEADDQYRTTALGSLETRTMFEQTQEKLDKVSKKIDEIEREHSELVLAHEPIPYKPQVEIEKESGLSINFVLKQDGKYEVDPEYDLDSPAINDYIARNGITKEDFMQEVEARKAELDAKAEKIRLAKEKTNITDAYGATQQERFYESIPDLKVLKAQQAYYQKYIDEHQTAYDTAKEDLDSANKRREITRNVVARTGNPTYTTQAMDIALDFVGSFTNYQSPSADAEGTVGALENVFIHKGSFTEEDRASINSAIDELQDIVDSTSAIIEMEDVPDNYKKWIGQYNEDIKAQIRLYKNFLMTREEGYADVVKSGFNKFWKDRSAEFEEYDTSVTTPGIGWAVMTDYEKDLFYAIYGTQGSEAAQQYYNDMEDDLILRSKEGIQRNAEARAETWLGRKVNTLLSIGLAVAEVPASMMYLAGAALHGDDGNDWLRMPSYASKQSYEQNIEKFHEIYKGTIWDDVVCGMAEMVYNRGRSAVIAAMYGPLFPAGTTEVVQAMPIATIAMADALDEAFEAGAEPWQAWTVATVNFFAESLTEGIEFKDIKGAFKHGKNGLLSLAEFLVNRWPNAIAEGVGETLNDIAEGFVNDIVMGDNSDRAKRIQEYVNQGYSPEDAEIMTYADDMKQCAHTFLISFLSSYLDIGIFGLGKLKSSWRYVDQWSKLNRAQETRTTLREIRSKDIQSLKDIQTRAKESNEKALNRDLKPFYAYEREGINPARLTEEAQKAQQPEYDTDIMFLSNSSNSDKGTVTSTLASVLFTDDMNTDQAIAAAENLPTILGEDTITAMMELWNGGLESGTNIQTLRLALQYAALTDGKCRALMTGNAYTQADAKTKAKYLSEAVMQDINNPMMQDAMAQATHESRVAAAEQQLMAQDEIRTQLETAEKKVSQYEQKTNDARSNLEKQQSVESAMADRVKEAGNTLAHNPGNSNRLALTAARNDLKHQRSLRVEAEATLKSAESAEKAARNEADNLKQKIRTDLRQQAEEAVAKEDQVRAEEAAKAAEEEQARLKTEELFRQTNNVSRMVAENVANRFTNLSEEDQNRVIDMAMEMQQQITADSVDSIFARQAFREGMEKRFGIKITEVDDSNTPEDERFNAHIDPDTGDITVSSFATQSDIMYAVLIHEITHISEDSNTYKELADTVLKLRYGDDITFDGIIKAMDGGDLSSKMAQDILAKKQRYDSFKGLDGKVHTYEEILKEIVADEVGRVISGDQKAIDMIGGNPSLAKRIINAIKSFIKKMKGIDDETITQAQKVADMLIAKVNEAQGKSNQTKFSLSSPTERLANGLTATHSLGFDAIRKMKDFNGLPAPSIAVSQTGDRVAGGFFGPITFVFGPDTINPQNDQRNYLFGRDSWTPTFPRTKKGLFGERFEQNNAKINAENAVELMWQMPLKQGPVANTFSDSETPDFRDDRLLAHHIAAELSKSYKNIEQIQAERERFGTKTQNEIFQALDAIGDKIDDVKEDVIRDIEASGRNIDELYDDRNQGMALEFIQAFRALDASEKMAREELGLSDETISAMKEILNAAKNIPTNYAEAKPMRVTDWNEVVEAFVPEDTPQDVLDILNQKGITYETYIDKYDRLDKMNNSSIVAKYRFSLAEDNQRYMDAVSNNDMATAQQLIDEAAKRAGYNIKAIHGTNAEFNVFERGDIGYHFGTEAQAEAKANQKVNNHGGNKRMITSYIKMENPLVLDFDAYSWDAPLMAARYIAYEDHLAAGLPYDESETASKVHRMFENLGITDSDIERLRSWDDGNQYFDEILERNGYDGIIYKNEIESNEGAYSYIVPLNKKGNIKVADAITYDDNGNVIPLSERFNDQKDDIRYSLPEEHETIDDKDGDPVATVLEGGTIAIDDKYSLNSFDAEERDRVRQALYSARNADGTPRFTKQQVDEYIQNAMGIAAKIAGDRNRLDFEVTDPDKSMWKPNSDYGGTIDASTLCAKRLVYQGTFDAIQHLLPNTPLMPQDLVHLADMMREMGYETPCGICYVESRRQNLDKYIHEWLQTFKGTENDDFIPKIDDVSTTDGLENVRKNHPETYKAFMKAMYAHGNQNNPKVVQLRTEYKGEIRSLDEEQVQKYINHGGIRLQSFSDFETPHLLDMVQVVMDIASKNMTAQAYTKVPNFAWVFGDTGIKINLSLIGKGTGVDENGNLVFDDVEGMNFEEAMKLRNRYSKNVGTVLVGMNDAHILAAMADPRIDYIIPFHSSGWTKADRKLMHMLDGYEDYEKFQTEKDVSTGAKTVQNKGNNIAPVGQKDDYGNGYWDFTKTGKENAETYLDLCYKNGLIPVFSKFLDVDETGHYRLKADGSTDGYWKLLIDTKMYDNDGVGSPQTAVTPDINMNQAYHVLKSYSLERQQPGAPAVKMENNNTLPKAMPVVERFYDEYKDREAKFAADREKLLSGKYSIGDIDLDTELSTIFDGMTDDEILTALGLNMPKSWQKEPEKTSEDAKHKAVEAAIEGPRDWAKLNADYMLAAESGDKERTAKMVRDKARDLGYFVYGTHRTNADFNEFKRTSEAGKRGATLGDGFYIAKGEGTEYDSDHYGKRRMLVYMNPGKTLDIWNGLTKKEARAVYNKFFAPHHPEAWDGYVNHVLEKLQSPTRMIDYVKEAAEINSTTTDQIFKWLGYNSIKDGPQYCVFDSSQIKLADPITYDDNGNVIPISERFSDSKDIRYSLPVDIEEYEDALERGDKLAAQDLVDKRAKSFGYIKSAFHGTLSGGFTEFDKKYANVRGNSGAGFYFSSSVFDSDDNYSDVEGADNWFKANALADKIMDQLHDSIDWLEEGETFKYEGYEIPEGTTYYDAVEIAKKILTKKPQTYHVYLNPGRAYIRDFNKSTNLLDEAIDSFDDRIYDRDDFDSDEDYEDAIREGRDEAIYWAINDAVYKAFDIMGQSYEIDWNGNYDHIIQKLLEKALDFDSLTWDDVLNVIYNDTHIFLSNDNGETFEGGEAEVTRAIIEGFGFDSIEDREVSKKFNQLKNMGNAGDTVHYVMFHPEQIKSADAVVYDDGGEVIPLRKRFNESSKDIRYSIPDLTDAQKKNYDYNQNQTEVGSTIKTLNGSALKRYGKAQNGPVGKEIGGHVYVHKNYAADVVPADVLAKAEAALHEAFPDYQYNAIRWDEKTNEIGFQEAPNFDTQREPVVGHTVTVNADGEITTKPVIDKKTGEVIDPYGKPSDYIWHHKWQWVRNDYDGFDVGESWNWSKQWASELREPSNGNGIWNWDAQLDKYGLPKDEQTYPGRLKYSLPYVDPVEPSGDAWAKSATYAEVKAEHPTLFEQSEDQSEDEEDQEGHVTQTTSTIHTYRKVYQMLKDEGFNGSILDASSGLGKGTAIGREEFGYPVVDIEPYPNKNYRPMYKDYSKHKRTYDFIISNAVLNVLPQDQRDSMIVTLGKMLNPGGRIFINVRGKDVATAKSAVPINADNMEYFIEKGNSYQKGFTKKELTAYIKDALGEGYSITNARSDIGDVAVIVTKDGGVNIAPTQRGDMNKKTSRYSIPSDAPYLNAVERGDNDTAKQLLDNAAQKAGYIYKGYHGTNVIFDFFDPAKLGSKNWMAPSAAMGFFAAGSRETAEAYTGLNSMDYASMVLNSESSEKMEQIKREHNFDEVYQKYEASQNEFFDEYKRSHGWQDAVEAPLETLQQNGFIRDDSILQNMRMMFEMHWNEDHSSEMYNAWYETDEHKQYEAFNQELMSEWEQYEIQRKGYIPNVKELYIKMENPFIYDFEGQGRDVESFAARMAYAKANGYDGCIFKNVADGGDLDTIYTVFNNTQFKSADTITYDDDGNVIPLSERFNEKKQSLRYSLPNDDILQGQVKQYLSGIRSSVADRNAMPLEGETWQNGSGPAQRQFGAETLQESDEIEQDVKDFIKRHDGYFPDTNEAQIKRAVRWIRSNKASRTDDGFYNSLQQVTSDGFDYRSADGQARMVAVMALAVKNNDVMSQVALADAFNRQGTDLGRALQARKLFRLMTPAGRIGSLMNMLNDAQKTINAKGTTVQLSFPEWIYQAASVATLEGDFDKVYKAAAEILGKQLPASWQDKFRAWRMLSMLGNPRTHIRNILGNAFFVPVVGLKNKMSAVFELGVEKGQKTKTLAPFLNKEVREFARQDARAIKDILTGEAKFNELKAYKPYAKPFKGLLQALIDFNSNRLEDEDWIFLRGHYRRALGGWMQANGYTAEQLGKDRKLLEKGRAYAITEAQKATYRDFNRLAATLNKVSRDGGLAGFVVDAALPFKKTPANILRRGLEYSPVGLMRSFTSDLYHLKQWSDYESGKLNALPEKAISPTQWIDNLCSGLTGSGILTVGALLSSMGIVSCGLGDDDDEFEKAMGNQKYALHFKIGGWDFTYTMDWAAPMSMPFFVGASLQHFAANRGISIDKLIDAFGNITEPVFNLSLLDGINTLFKTSQNEETNTLTQIGAKILSNYATSYVPSLFGAIHRTVFDNTRRKNFVESGKGTGVTGTFRYAWEQVENKLPLDDLGLVEENIPVRNIWGEEDVSTWYEAAIENFISPGYHQLYKNDPLIGEMKRLYGITKDKDMIPEDDPAKTFTYNNQKVVLTDKEWDTLKMVRGQTAKKELTELIGSNEYKNANATVQTQMIKDVWKHAEDMGRNAVRSDYEVADKTIEEIAEGSKITGLKNDMMTELNNGNYVAFETMVEALLEEGLTESDIKQKINGKYLKPYKAAYRKGDNAAKAEITDILINTGLYTYEDFDRWESQVDKE